MGAVSREFDCNRCGREGSHNPRMETFREPRREQSGQRTNNRQNQRSHEDDRRETRETVSHKEKRLRQPFVRQIEMLHLIFAVERSRVGKGVWNGQRTMLDNVLAGFEMPPEVGVRNFSGE